MDSTQSAKTEYVWRSPLLQAVGTLRASGQIYCAQECEKLWKILHDYDPGQRSEVKIVEELIAKTDSPTLPGASG